MDRPNCFYRSPPYEAVCPGQAIDRTGRRIVKYFTYCHRFCWYQ
jgi:hypothetical protein